MKKDVMAQTNLIDETREKEFKAFLDSTSLLENEKKNFHYIIGYFKNEIPRKFVSRSCLIYGDPGIGKTHFMERLLPVFNVPVLYAGPSKKHEKFTSFEGLVELSKEIKKYEEYVVFIDDLDHELHFEFGEGLTFEHKKAVMDILEAIKNADKKIALFMTANSRFALDEAMYDRIECKIEMDVPTEVNKKEFLKNMYSRLLKKRELDHIAMNSIGYNFRDLPEVVKVAFREGNKIITEKSINLALRYYKPSSMSDFQVLNNIYLKFSDIVGKESVKKMVNKAVIFLKRRQDCQRLGLKRANLLIFYGPPGTGKTYFAKALAGELGIPIVKIDALSFSRGGYFSSMHRISRLANRFKNCILFIDEADKLLARGTFDEDSVPQSYLNDLFDGIENSAESLVILSLNDLHRFGNALIDRFSCIKFDYPTTHERLEFLKKKVEESNVNIDINLRNAARMTEKMSFRDMEKIWNELIFYVIENKSVNDNILSSTINEMKRKSEHLEMFG